MKGLFIPFRTLPECCTRCLISCALLNKRGYSENKETRHPDCPLVYVERKYQEGPDQILQLETKNQTKVAFFSILCVGNFVEITDN